MTATTDTQVNATTTPHQAEVLTPDALAFIAGLQREFNPTRERLLAERAERQARLDAGERPDGGARAGRWCHCCGGSVRSALVRRRERGA